MAWGGSIWDGLAARKVSRRGFLEFCTSMGAALALPADETPRIVEALETKERLPVIWLHGQECTGDDESFIRAGTPDVTRVLLDMISLEYSEVLMVDSGASAESKLAAAMERYAGRYLVIQEGSVPTGENAYFCTVGGRSCEDVLREATRNCAGIIALGACASWGGWPASRPNPTGAKGVHQIITDKPVVNLTGCPHNGVNAVATIVYYITYGDLPPLDALGRPLFAHGKRIHDNCERRAHFDAGQFVEKWGDEGHRQGWCLYKMGCKGPQAYYNCPVERWNDGTSWPVRSGHGCIACASFDFWDAMTPFYGRLPQVPILPVEATVDRIGLILSAAALVGVAAHATTTAVWSRHHGLVGPRARQKAEAAEGPEPGAPPEAPGEKKPPDGAPPLAPPDDGPTAAAAAPTEEDGDGQ